MYIYLPIAEVSMNIFAISGLGAIVGFLSGLFGVGGGFLMTPLLIFLGIPAAVAVSTEANQIVASSVETATAAGIPRNIKRGVIRNPPPTPKRPERNPPIAPSPEMAKIFIDTSAIGKYMYINNKF